MNTGDITLKWFKKQKFVLQNTSNKPSIDGVICKKLSPIVDDRGDLTELWSTGWPDSSNFLQPVHCYQSTTRSGVTKGWHLHKSHISQIAITKGKLQLVLVDVRLGSNTFGITNNMYVGIENPSLVKIPSGIMYAWKALSQSEVIVTSFHPHLYDPEEDFHFSIESILSHVWDGTRPDQPSLPEKS